jgi:triacylglycerol esterase/lipase EstA (alpha/beta hydrolase family)
MVFVHGLWLHAASWGPWVDVFQEAGYAPVAPGWPGDTVELSRANPDAIANRGIDEVADHYAGIVRALDRPPILIGHSFGGTIAEKLLGENHGAAQIKGVLPLPLSVCKNPANIHHAVSHQKYTIPAPGRPLFEAAVANVAPHSPAKAETDNEARGPLLLVMGGQDHTQYRHSSAVTEFVEFHRLTRP